MSSTANKAETPDVATNDPKRAPILKFANEQGEFQRQASTFRDVISRAPGARFPPEKDRYHLYISLACPWAHRTLLVRNMKGLDKYIGLSVVDYLMGPEGWKFSEASETPGAIPDTVNGAKFLRELYFKANPNYQGRFTVPVLWDKKTQTIVNNESSEIIRFLNSEFNDIVPEARNLDLYPEALRDKVDELNAWIYDTVNNGVYKAGFATRQDVYETHCKTLFDSLDKIEEILSNNEFLTGNQLTEADLRLWTTIIRFDPVYHGHFKCNLKSIGKDYPHILRWARQIYQMPGVADTVNMEHIKRHYYMSHLHINPTAIVPLSNGPDLSRPIIKP